MRSGNGLHTRNCCTCRLHQGGFQYLRCRLVAMCQCALDGLHITLGTPAPFTQQQWASLPREFQASRPDIRGHVGWEASNVCLHCVPITLQWSRAYIHNVCDMWTRFCTIGIPYNGVSNTKARIMCWYSCTSATRGVGGPSHICRREDTLDQLKRRFLRGISCAKGTTSANGLDRPQGCAGMGGVGWQMTRGKLSIQQRYMDRCDV